MALGRAASTILRELRRNALDSDACRRHVADGAYMLRRQRACLIERDAKLAASVTVRFSEDSTPEQINLTCVARVSTGRLGGLMGASERAGERVRSPD